MAGLCHAHRLLYVALQDKVVNSISELYSFMDSADATLALKVLGEVDDNGEPVRQHSEEGGCAVHDTEQHPITPVPAQPPALQQATCELIAH